MKVSLRPIEDSDTKNILKWRNNLNVRSNFIFQEEISIETHERWVNENINTGKAVQFIIVTEELGDVGSTYLRDIDNINLKAEFGIFIGEENARGKGFGTEAARLVLEQAFDILKLNKVFLRVLANNIIAIRSYELAGFSKEGCFVEDVIIDSKPCDVVFMAMLRTQYKMNRSNM